jgi:hypothetical protein
MKLFTYLFFIFCLLACEGFIGGSGVVKDQDGNPIADAQLLLRIRGNTLDTILYTDSLGKYQIRWLVRCVPKCPTAEIKFFQKGYNSNVVNAIPKIRDTTIILEENIQ